MVCTKSSQSKKEDYHWLVAVIIRYSRAGCKSLSLQLFILYTICIMETNLWRLCRVAWLPTTSELKSEKQRIVLISNDFREVLLKLEKTARDFIGELKEAKDIDWEVFAQATLAMRHIEDARMRYGKVIQYLWDWESIYDK